MKIKKIKIKKFRSLSGIDIEFYSHLNAIAGQNGTFKTSMLGLIGHIFNFSGANKTLMGKKFTTQFSEIFKFAYPDYDPAGSHVWETIFDNDKSVVATSYNRKEKGKQDEIRVRVGRSEQGSGKIDFPVIYLGMGRLFPINLESKINEGIESSLTIDEIRIFEELHNEVLLINHRVTPKPIKCSSKKNFYAPITDNYNYLGNSAGQDNLGQIITALISFKRLQQELGDGYRGGILLIDEIDASLFPAAQIKLIEKLYQKSLELNLQIFFTTHSLEVLNKTQTILNSGIIFLDNSYGYIIPKYNLNIRELTQNLLVMGPDALKEVNKKKYVYCEDDEAKDFLKNILTRECKRRVEIISTKLGHTVLKDIAEKRIPDFKNSIIVLDGDSSSVDVKNVLILPGEKGPDSLIYDFLKRLDAGNNFWKKAVGYSYQFCFKDLLSLNSSTDKRKQRTKLKDWYKVQRKYWGRLGVNAWNLWIEENLEEVEKFREKFIKLI